MKLVQCEHFFPFRCRLSMRCLLSNVLRPPVVLCNTMRPSRFTGALYSRMQFVERQALFFRLFSLGSFTRGLHHFSCQCVLAHYASSGCIYLVLCGWQKINTRFLWNYIQFAIVAVRVAMNNGVALWQWWIASNVMSIEDSCCPAFRSPLPLFRSSLGSSLLAWCSASWKKINIEKCMSDGVAKSN